MKRFFLLLLALDFFIVSLLGIFHSTPPISHNLFFCYSAITFLNVLFIAAFLLLYRGIQIGTNSSFFNRFGAATSLKFFATIGFFMAFYIKQGIHLYLILSFFFAYFAFSAVMLIPLYQMLIGKKD